MFYEFISDFFCDSVLILNTKTLIFFYKKLSNTRLISNTLFNVKLAQLYYHFSTLLTSGHIMRFFSNFLKRIKDKIRFEIMTKKEYELFLRKKRMVHNSSFQ